MTYFSSSPSFSFPSHPLHICTAFSHLPNLLSLSFPSILGWNTVVPAVFTLLSSSKEDQTPTANPAAMAAPRAVVSSMRGRETGMPVRSAWVFGGLVLDLRVFGLVWRGKGKVVKREKGRRGTGGKGRGGIPACKDLNSSFRHRQLTLRGHVHCLSPWRPEWLWFGNR